MKLFSDFNFTALSSWITFVDLPRFPILYVLDSISCCYIVRTSLNIFNPVYSLVLSLIMATTTDSLTSYFISGKVALLTDPLLAPIHLLIWVLFNFSSKDIVFKLVRLVSPVLAFICGFNEGREITLAVDIANKRYNFWVYKIAFSTLFTSAKFIEISFYGKCVRQKVRSPGPIMFVSALTASGYYWLTDYGTLFESFVLPKETARLLSILFISLLSIIRHFVRDEYYTKMWASFEYLLGSFVPFYGKTWIPPKEPRNLSNEKKTD